MPHCFRLNEWLGRTRDANSFGASDDELLLNGQFIDAIGDSHKLAALVCP
jgi:hypothetical protein